MHYKINYNLMYLAVQSEYTLQLVNLDREMISPVLLQCRALSWEILMLIWRNMAIEPTICLSG